MRVLVCDQSERNRNKNAALLRTSGFTVTVAETTEDAGLIVENYSIDLILAGADADLKKNSRIIFRFRRLSILTPIVLLAPPNADWSKADCLDNGADDVLAEGLDDRELVARLRAVIRRSAGHAEATLRVGDLTFNLNTQVVEVAGLQVDLTKSQMEILQLLLLRRRSAVSRQTIMDSLYGGEREPDMRVIDVVVFQLRRKLATYGLDELIETVRGVGYRMCERGGPRQGTPTLDDDHVSRQQSFSFLLGTRAEPCN